MADILDFLTRVVPWPEASGPGLINLHWTSLKGPGMRGRPYTSPRDLLAMAQWGATKPSVMKDIYFCLSSQRATGKVINGIARALRNAKNVHMLKALWMDIDVKEKGYANINEALDALTAFVQAAAIPGPTALVLSGGGIQVYWISKTPLTKEEWTPYAEGLEALAKKHGLKNDPGLTTDSARLLRIPGTFNYKTTPPKGVRLAALGPVDIDFVQRLGHLIGVISPVTVPVTKPHFDLGYDPKVFPLRAPPPTGFIDSLAAGVHTHIDTPLNYAEVVKNCAHFRHACSSEGADAPQGLWMLDVLASTFMQDARGLAHLVSRKYKTYVPDETDAMFDRKVTERAEKGMGWPSCAAFEAAGSKQCATCPFKGKIRSPLNLAERASAPLHPVVVAPPPPPELNLPDDYTTLDGYICAIVTKTLQGGGEQDEPVQLFRCRIKNPETQGGASRSLQFHAQIDKTTTRTVIVREADMATEPMLMRSLWGQGVKTYVEHEKRIRPFMSAWLQRLDDVKKRISTLPFGWLIEDGEYVGFAYNSTVYRADGQDHPSGTADAHLQAAFTPQGSMQPWLDVMKVITDQHRPDLEVLATIGFAAPLIAVSGQYAGMIIGTSAESGAHKSTGLRSALAVWASPKLSKDVPSASDISLGIKLGALRNLPLVWDELSDESKIMRVIKYVGEFTEGIVGNKANQDRTLRVPAEWQSIIGIGANLSIWDKVIEITKATDAQLRRLFEICVVPVPGKHRMSDIQRLTNSLDYNYGWAGVRYAEYLGRNPELIWKDAKEIMNAFEDDVKVVDGERFWAAVCGACIVGAVFANRTCGVHFNVMEIYAYLKKEFMAHRDRIKRHAVVAGSKLNVSDVLSQFLKAYPDNQLWITTKPKGRGRQSFTIIHQNDVMHPKPVHIQWVRDDRVVRLSQTEFEKFVRLNKYAWSAVFEGLREHYNVLPVGRIDLGAWTPQVGGPENVIELPIPPAHDLEQRLFQYTPLNEYPADYGVKAP